MGEERGMERKKGASRRSREGWYNTCSVRFHPSHRRRQSSARPVRYLIRSRLSSADSITRIHVTLPRGAFAQEKKRKEKKGDGKGDKKRVRAF